MWFISFLSNSLSTWAGREQWQLWDGESNYSDCPEPRQGSQRSVHPPQVRHVPHKFYFTGNIRAVAKVYSILITCWIGASKSRSDLINGCSPPNSKILISKQKIIDLFPRIEKTLESIKDADNTVMQMQIKRQREFWHLLKIACVSSVCSCASVYCQLGGFYMWVLFSYIWKCNMDCETKSEEGLCLWKLRSYHHLSAYISNP